MAHPTDCTGWIADSLGNFFALIRDEDGVSMVSTDTPDVSPVDHYEAHILSLSEEEGIILSGANFVNGYPCNDEPDDNPSNTFGAYSLKHRQD